MLARIRINVPDRPGSLGGVASAIGAAAGDIVKVDVLATESGRALDDVFVAVRGYEHAVRVCDHLAAVPGVSVVGVQHPAPPVAGHADLELLRQVLADRERGLRTLVDSAPGAVGADWGAIVSYAPEGDPGEVLAVSPGCPGADRVRLRSAMKLAAVRVTPSEGEEPYGGAALVPLGDRVALVLVREDGPDFHQSELWRLGQIGEMVALIVGTSEGELVVPEA